MNTRQSIRDVVLVDVAIVSLCLDLSSHVAQGKGQLKLYVQVHYDLTGCFNGSYSLLPHPRLA